MIAATAALGALRNHWKLAAGIGGLIAFAILFALWKGEKRHSAKLETRIVELTDLRKADRAAYTNAQIAAKAKNEAQVTMIEASQEEVSNDVSKDYAGDLARLRDELGRVRQQKPAPSSSPARSAQASRVPQAPERSDGAPVPLSPSDLLLAAETELQLDALQTWIEAQAKVAR